MTPTERATVIYNMLEYDRRFLNREAFVAMAAAVIAGGEVEAAQAVQRKCARIARLHGAEIAADIIEEIEVDW